MPLRRLGSSLGFEEGYENYLPKIDQLVYALFTDLDRRGLLQKTCVVLCGEFGRTPRMNDGGGGAFR
ncbi:MAG: DUF1501 domain-containing protein [Pirellulales bacterium]